MKEGKQVHVRVTDNNVHIIGGGLAGSEAAWQLARCGIPVTLHEMRRGGEKTFAHTGDGLAELVCSNSFRSDDPRNNAVGLLHEEMRVCRSLIMRAADACALPAGGALAVDRERFSAAVGKALAEHPLVTVTDDKVTDFSAFGDSPVIVASGPLTAPELTDAIINITGQDQLAFFDAIAPVLYTDSIDFSVAWRQSRYDKGEGKDYINLPLNEQQYYRFVELLLIGDTADFKDWEKNTPYFNGCLPVEVMAERGLHTLRYGPMKPVGLRNPHKAEQPYAVVQLRQDNKAGTLYNMVGFQTKLKYGAQQEVFRTIPGLQDARFARLGGIHRNTFIKSPLLLDKRLRLTQAPHLRFAGQITGVEGYVESAAGGLLAGVLLAAELKGREEITLPGTNTAIGALADYITEPGHAENFQPMNINYGLISPPPGAGKGKRADRGAYYDASMKAIKAWHAEKERTLRGASAAGASENDDNDDDNGGDAPESGKKSGGFLSFFSIA